MIFDKHLQRERAESVQERLASGESVMTLSNGYAVKTLTWNPDGTLLLNGETTVPLKEFHSLGGIAGFWD